MSERKDGGTAFPTVSDQHYGDGMTAVTANPGMTLRQWYAGMAMNGFLATMPRATDTEMPHLFEIAALRSFQLADAMIAEGSK